MGLFKQGPENVHDTQGLGSKTTKISYCTDAGNLRYCSLNCITINFLDANELLSWPALCKAAMLANSNGRDWIYQGHTSGFSLCRLADDHTAIVHNECIQDAGKTPCYLRGRVLGPSAVQSTKAMNVLEFRLKYSGRSKAIGNAA